MVFFVFFCSCFIWIGSSFWKKGFVYYYCCFFLNLVFCGVSVCILIGVCLVLGFLLFGFVGDSGSSSSSGCNYGVYLSFLFFMLYMIGLIIGFSME